MTQTHIHRAAIGGGALLAWIALIALYAYGLLGWGALVVLLAMFVYSVLRLEWVASGVEYDPAGERHYLRLIGWTGGALALAIFVVLG